MSSILNDLTPCLPFETSELRRLLELFLNKTVKNPLDDDKQVKVGDFQWGVYCFYDYDDEPIYVGQTKESLRVRIRRHLTNQRTDAVAMNVLDPFEVYKIVVYPLPQLDGRKNSDLEAKKILDSLERKIYDRAIDQSKFHAILNEKDPPIAQIEVKIPASFEGVIVSEAVDHIRRHPDVRIARRSQTVSRLAQVISERKVNEGLRKTMHTQIKRLEWLSEERMKSAGKIVDED